MVFKKGHPDYRNKISIGDHINCKFCNRNFINEEIQRTHLLFAHNFLMPRCESKAYFSHIKKIDALRKQFHILRKRINDRLYREHWYDYTKHMMRQYDAEQLEERKPEWMKRYRFQHLNARNMTSKQFDRRALFNHNRDMKNYAFVKHELDKNGILIDV